MRVDRHTDRQSVSAGVPPAEARPTLRILQLNSLDRGGGAEAVALALHVAFRERGHDCELAVGRVKEGGAGISRISQGRGPFWWAHERLDRRRLYRTARLARAFMQPGTITDALQGHEDCRFPGAHQLLDSAVGLDVLQLHNLHGGYFDLGVLPRLAASVPTVATLHDAWMLTGHCAHPFDCERWASACGACPYLDTYPALHRDGTAFNLRRKAAIFEETSLTVVTPSRWLMSMVDQSVLARAVTQSLVIPNGVDLNDFRPRDRIHARRTLDIDRERLLLVTASQDGQESPFRDAATLTEALERLGRADGEPVDVVALGEAEASVRRFGRVTLKGVRRVPPRMMRVWLNAADAYVHTARADTFPTSILEALGSGAPVVATAVGGVPEQVRSLEDEPDPTGILVAAGDAAALARALDCLLRDSELRTRLGKNAATDARRRFSLDDQVTAYLDLYHEVLEARPRGRR